MSVAYTTAGVPTRAATRTAPTNVPVSEVNAVWITGPVPVSHDSIQ